MIYIFLYIISFRSSYETLEFTTSACLKLLEICLKDLTLRSEQLEVICVLIRLLLTSIQRQRKQMARSPSDQEYQAKEGKVISQLLEFLKAKLGGELSKMACYNESKVLLTELQVYMKWNWYKVVYNLRQNRPWETCEHKLLFVRNRFKRVRTERLKHERSCTMSNLYSPTTALEPLKTPYSQMLGSKIQICVIC